MCEACDDDESPVAANALVTLLSIVLSSPESKFKFSTQHPASWQQVK